MARRLNVPAFGLAIGIVGAVIAVLVTWMNWITGGLDPPAGLYAPFVRAMDAAFPFYRPTFLGGIWGGVCALVVGTILGGAIALVYNRLATPMDEDEEDTPAV